MMSGCRGGVDGVECPLGAVVTTLVVSVPEPALFTAPAPNLSLIFTGVVDALVL